jgi:hypothetical protein
MNTCYDKYLTGMVYIHTGETVENIPDGGAGDVLMMLVKPWQGFHVKAACMAFMVVWF